MNIQQIQQNTSFKAKLPIIGSNEDVRAVCSILSLENPEVRYLTSKIVQSEPKDEFSVALLTTGKDALKLSQKHGDEISPSSMISLLRQIEAGVVQPAKGTLQKLLDGVRPTWLD